MRRCVSVSVFVLLAICSGASANSLKAGDRIRVIQGSTDVVGRIVSLDQSSLVLHADESDRELMVYLNSVDRIQISDGAKRNTGAGALIGAFLGGAIGFALVASADFEGADSSENAIVVFGFTAAGAAVGGAIGFVAKSERWTQVPLESSGLDHGSSVRVVRVGLAVNF